MKRFNNRWLAMLSLVLAGESIYMLVTLRRTFQTSMEEVFSITGTELGAMNGLFGILAFVSYLPGGWVADQFSARKMIAVSLLITGLSGFYMLTEPSATELFILHGFWGGSTIFTFWAPLIKATRGWGDGDEQGKSFGFLDGGRGVVGALLATIAAGVFDFFGDTRAESLNAVIYVYCFSNFLSAAAVWFFLEDNDLKASKMVANKPKKNIGEIIFSVFSVLKMPGVWFLSAVIFCSYFIYLGTFDLPAFAEIGYNRSKEYAAYLGSFRDWMRPIAAVGAGVLADRVGGSSRVILASFIMALLGYVSLYFLPTSISSVSILFVQIAVVSSATFALRGIYYALLEEGNVPKMSTGTVVGFASLMGYTPEIFVHYLAGWFRATYEGAAGFHNYFGFLAIISLFGVLATSALILYEKRVESMKEENFKAAS